MMAADKKPTTNSHQRWLQFASLAIDISNVTRNASNNAHKVIGAIYPANWISDLQKGGTMPAVICAALSGHACQVIHQSGKKCAQGALRFIKMWPVTHA